MRVIIMYTETSLVLNREPLIIYIYITIYNYIYIYI